MKGAGVRQLCLTVRNVAVNPTHSLSLVAK